VNYAICISGAASGRTVEGAKESAERLGRAVAKAGHTTISGATVGLPFYAARAAKKAGGLSIGYSPATNLREHVLKYRLPIGMFDYVNFTGVNYIGRDMHLVLSSDAVITIGGRFGTLNEFTIAIEAGILCGVLLGSGGTADLIPELLQKLDGSRRDQVIFDDEPERLVAAIVKRLDKEYEGINTRALKDHWYLDDSPRVDDHSG
jgi:uncharacterized protein (TIGR00725 family)